MRWTPPPGGIADRNHAGADRVAEGFEGTLSRILTGLLQQGEGGIRHRGKSWTTSFRRINRHIRFQDVGAIGRYDFAR